MRRLLALILILIIPLQFTWSAVAAVHGHAGEDPAALGLHAHAHGNEHQDSGHPNHDLALTGDMDQEHGEDGHHACHYHPVFSFILIDYGLNLGLSAPGGPVLHPPAAFLSRIPPLLDRPPLARA